MARRIPWVPEQALCSRSSTRVIALAASGRHRLDAARAMTLVLERLHSACSGTQGILLAIPAYLTHAQATLLSPLAHKVKLPVLGSVRAPLAGALAAYAAEPWTGLALVIDADDHALTATTVMAGGDQLWIQAAQAWPALNSRSWKERILNKVAECCIRQSRRDPRECAPAEQAL